MASVAAAVRLFNPPRIAQMNKGNNKGSQCEALIKRRVRSWRYSALSSLLLVLAVAPLMPSSRVTGFVVPQQGLSSMQRGTCESRFRFASVKCNLFFKNPTIRRRAKWKVPDSALEDLSNGSITLPYQIDLEYQGSGTSQEPQHLIVRNLEMEDLPSVVPMCVKEFGDGDPIHSIGEIPWHEIMSNEASVDNVAERICFGPLVRFALQMKIQRQLAGDDSSRPNIKPDDSVLCLAANDGTILGIVELSIQPPDAERNPPPLPLPLWTKKLWSMVCRLPPPDGWVTNLLIDDDYRGLGYSKVLMKAVEGLARSWECSAIHLHVDADTVSGKVAQGLYRGLGYEPVLDERAGQRYGWMGPKSLILGLYVVDDVPLLFLRKDLTDS